MFYSWPEKSSKGEYLLVTIIILLGILFVTIDYRNTFGRYIKLEYSKLYEVSVTKIEVNKGFLLNDEYWIWPKDTDDYAFIEENISAPFLFVKNKNSDLGLFITNIDTIKIKMSFGD